MLVCIRVICCFFSYNCKTEKDGHFKIFTQAKVHKPNSETRNDSCLGDSLHRTRRTDDLYTAELWAVVFAALPLSCAGNFSLATWIICSWLITVQVVPALPHGEVPLRLRDTHCGLPHMEGAVTKWCSW